MFGKGVHLFGTCLSHPAAQMRVPAVFHKSLLQSYEANPKKTDPHVWTIQFLYSGALASQVEQKY